MSEGCPECGGWAMEGTLLHWDGCSKRVVPLCFFCGQPSQMQTLYWSCTVRDGRVSMPTFHPLCNECRDRPKHVLDAIVESGGKPLD